MSSLHSDSILTSQGIVSTCTPKARHASAIVFISEVTPICSAAKSAPLGVPRSLITILHPSEANLSAIASPIPLCRPEPVIMATLLVSWYILYGFKYRWQQ